MGTGPSIETVDVELLEHSADVIIAVNGAIHRVNCHYWFTLDLSPENLRIINNPLPGVQYVVAHHKRTPKHVKKLGRVAETHVFKPPADDTPEYYLWRYGAVLGLQENPSLISTGNSAYGALNFAYHLRPDRVALFGIDGIRNTRSRSDNLSHLPLLFASTLQQLQRAEIGVINGSLISRIGCFDKLSPDEACAWLRG